MKHLGIWIGALVLITTGCFEDPGSTLSSEAETGTGDGDGDSSGDGDGDSTAGDGDTDASGDGDGDPATGDGDGDASGDGDGDADDSEAPVFTSFTVDGETAPPLLEAAAFVELAAEVSDNVGVTRVEFYVGDELIGEDEAEPWSLSWRVDDQSYNGANMISARAYDAANNQGDSEIIDLGVALPEPGTLVWEAKLAAGLRVEDLAVDGQGAIVGVGYVSEGDESNNFVIYKLARSDGGVVWERDYDNGQRNDQAWAVGVTEDDAVIVGGNSSETGCPQQLCDHLAVTRRYDADGNFEWMSTDAGLIRDLDIADNGDIVVAGTDDDDVYVRRWLPDGSGVWSTPWDHSDSDSGRGVAVLPSDRIVVSGAADHEGSGDVFVQLRMPNGQIADTQFIDCQDQTDFTFDMTGDDAGNVYVAMRLCGDNSTVHKYDQNGNLVWDLDESDFGDVGGFNGIRAIATGPNGTLALATWAGSPLNVWVAKYTQDGGQEWTASTTDDQMSTSVADAVAIDELGYVYVGGRMVGEDVGWVGCFHP